MYLGHVAINGAEKPSRDRLSRGAENSAEGGNPNDNERLESDIKGFVDSRKWYIF